MRSESEGWTGLDGEGEAQGGLRMMPLEAGERPSPGNLAETSCTGKVPALYPCLLFLSPASLPWDFFGRNGAKAETPVLRPPYVMS